MDGDKKLPRVTTCEDLMAKAVEAFEPERAETKQLSKRERQVVALLAQGLATGEVADYLSLSKNTVSTYLARIHRKVGTSTAVQLAVIWARAEERGLTA
jgi:DNA-binding CsgD family transcriptional regulator